MKASEERRSLPRGGLSPHQVSEQDGGEGGASSRHSSRMGHDGLCLDIACKSNDEPGTLYAMCHDRRTPGRDTTDHVTDPSWASPIGGAITVSYAAAGRQLMRVKVFTSTHPRQGTCYSSSDAVPLDTFEPPAGESDDKSRFPCKDLSNVRPRPVACLCRRNRLTGHGERSGGRPN